MDRSFSTCAMYDIPRPIENGMKVIDILNSLKILTMIRENITTCELSCITDS